MSSRPIGSAVAATGGLLFVLINASAVPAGLLWQVVAVVAAALIVWLVVLRGPQVEHAPPSREALRTYGFSVVAMVLAIPVGARFISQVLNEPDASLIWVVFVVGLHFWPFAHAFGMPIFRAVSWSLVVVAAIGAVSTLVIESTTAAGATGVAAGFVLLAFSALGPRLTRRSGSEGPDQRSRAASV